MTTAIKTRTIKAGETLTSVSLGVYVRTFAESPYPRFFAISWKTEKKNKPLRGLYVMAAVSVEKHGSTFQLLKVCGVKKLPNLAVIQAGKPLTFDVEVFSDAENLCEFIASNLSKNERQTVLNLDPTLEDAIARGMLARE